MTFGLIEATSNFGFCAVCERTGIATNRTTIPSTILIDLPFMSFAPTIIHLASSFLAATFAR